MGDVNTALTKDQMVETILGYDVAIGNLERQIKVLKEQQADTEAKLLFRMDNDGDVKFTDTQGRTVAKDEQLIMSVDGSDKQLWFDWADEIKRPEIVKTSINRRTLSSLIRKAIRCEDPSITIPRFLDIEKDIFWKPRITIKLGRRSLRRQASEATEKGPSEDF